MYQKKHILIRAMGGEEKTHPLGQPCGMKGNDKIPWKPQVRAIGWEATISSWG